MTVHYQNLEEIEDVVRGFESCSTGKDEFTHARHLTVALWYLHTQTLEEAANKMRTGLLRFLNHHEVPPGKYNETITLFWLKVVNAFAVRHTGSTLNSTGAPASPDEQIVSLANGLINTFAKARLVFDYYSESLISSPAAKSGWVEPDLKEFDL
jgi:hypothetical protein